MKKSLISLAVAMCIPALSFGIMRATEGSQATILDLDSMMDTEMDKVENVPDFVTPPPGNYRLKVSDCKIEKYQPKAKEGEAKKAEANRIKIMYEVVATIETKELPVKDGSLFSESFMGTEDGLKYFKKQARNILNVEDFEGAKLRDVIDGIKNAEFDAAITIKKTSDGYENVQVRPVHVAA